MYFKRIIASKATIERAKLIMDGNLLVHPLWPTVKYNKISWDEDPFNDITWCFYLHSLDLIGYLMNAYEVESNNDYLIKSQEIIESWIKANPSEENQMSFYAWKDHSVANRVVNMIQFWMNYKDSAVYDEKFEDLLMESLIQHGDYLLLDSNHTFVNNHGIFQDRSLIQLAITFPQFKNSQVWYEVAINRFMSHVDKDVSKSGAHLEHSDSYHMVVMWLFNSVNQFLIYHNKKINRLSELLYKMEEYLAYVVKLNNSIPMTGDSGPDLIRNIKEENIKNENLMFVKTKGKKGIKPKNAILYKDVGTAIIRNNWNYDENQIYLRLLAAYHSKVHKHADDLSFLLTIGNTDFFVDSGKYNYRERDPYRKYFRSSLAHNTITVNNKTYLIESELIGKSKINKYIDNPKFIYVQAVHELYADTKIKRTIIYVKDTELILIFDDIESEKKQEYSQIFNLGEDINFFQLNNRRYFLESNINGKIIELLQVDKIEKFKHYKGNQKPIRAWISNDFNKKTPINQLEFVNEGTNRQYRTIINTDINNGAKYFSVLPHKDVIRIRIRYKNERIDIFEVDK